MEYFLSAEQPIECWDTAAPAPAPDAIGARLGSGQERRAARRCMGRRAPNSRWPCALPPISSPSPPDGTFLMVSPKVRSCDGLEALYAPKFFGRYQRALLRLHAEGRGGPPRRPERLLCRQDLPAPAGQRTDWQPETGRNRRPVLTRCLLGARACAYLRGPVSLSL